MALEGTVDGRGSVEGAADRQVYSRYGPEKPHVGVWEKA